MIMVVGFQEVATAVDNNLLGVGDEPVDGRKVLALCQLLIQSPKHLFTTTVEPLLPSTFSTPTYLHDTKGGRCHRVGEITTGR
jgi:hypothetical protein